MISFLDDVVLLLLMYIERMNQIKNFKVISTENKLMIQTETRFENKISS